NAYFSRQAVKHTPRAAIPTKGGVAEVHEADVNTGIGANRGHGFCGNQFCGNTLEKSVDDQMRSKWVVNLSKRIPPRWTRKVGEFLLCSPSKYVHQKSSSSIRK